MRWPSRDLSLDQLKISETRQERRFENGGTGDDWVPWTAEFERSGTVHWRMKNPEPEGSSACFVYEFTFGDKGMLSGYAALPSRLWSQTNFIHPIVWFWWGNEWPYHEPKQACSSPFCVTTQELGGNRVFYFLFHLLCAGAFWLFLFCFTEASR